MNTSEKQQSLTKPYSFPLKVTPSLRIKQFACCFSHKGSDYLFLEEFHVCVPVPTSLLEQFDAAVRVFMCKDRNFMNAPMKSDNMPKFTDNLITYHI